MNNCDWIFITFYYVLFASCLLLWLIVAFLFDFIVALTETLKVASEIVKGLVLDVYKESRPT